MSHPSFLHTKLPCEPSFGAINVYQGANYITAHAISEFHFRTSVYICVVNSTGLWLYDL